MAVNIPEQLKRIAAGDSAAKAWLYDTYASGLLRKLEARYGAYELDARDLLQDAYLSFFQHDGRALSRFLDRHSAEQQTLDQLRIYLWDIACGVASNRLRDRRTRRRYLPEADHDLSFEAAEDSPEREFVRRDQMRRFIDCVAESGEQARLYFALRFVDGLTADEIAQVTGWPLPQVYRLRAKLGTAAEECANRLQMDRG
ncbi:MAG: sigma-70 family RNA polymerase sigma factor [Acidobacteriota bacterium]